MLTCHHLRAAYALQHRAHSTATPGALLRASFAAFRSSLPPPPPLPPPQPAAQRGAPRRSAPPAPTATLLSRSPASASANHYLLQFAASGDFPSCERAWQALERVHGVVDAGALEAWLGALVRAGRGFEAAAALARALAYPGTVPSARMLQVALEVCACPSGGGGLRAAMEVWAALVRSGPRLQPPRAAYHALLRLCAAEASVQHAQAVLDLMWQGSSSSSSRPGPRPDAQAYAHAMLACAHAGRPYTAFSLLQELQERAAWGAGSAAAAAPWDALACAVAFARRSSDRRALQEEWRAEGSSAAAQLQPAMFFPSTAATCTLLLAAAREGNFVAAFALLLESRLPASSGAAPPATPPEALACVALTAASACLPGTASDSAGALRVLLATEAMARHDCSSSACSEGELVSCGLSRAMVIGHALSGNIKGSAEALAGACAHFAAARGAASAPLTPHLAALQEEVLLAASHHVALCGAAGHSAAPATTTALLQAAHLTPSLPYAIACARSSEWCGDASAAVGTLAAVVDAHSLPASRELYHPILRVAARTSNARAALAAARHMLSQGLSPDLRSLVLIEEAVEGGSGGGGGGGAAGGGYSLSIEDAMVMEALHSRCVPGQEEEGGEGGGTARDRVLQLPRARLEGGAMAVALEHLAVNKAARAAALAAAASAASAAAAGGGGGGDAGGPRAAAAAPWVMDSSSSSNTSLLGSASGMVGEEEEEEEEEGEADSFASAQDGEEELVTQTVLAQLMPLQLAGSLGHDHKVSARDASAARGAAPSALAAPAAAAGRLALGDGADASSLEEGSSSLLAGSGEEEVGQAAAAAAAAAAEEEEEEEEVEKSVVFGVRLLQVEAVGDRDGKKVFLRGPSGLLVRAPTLGQALDMAERSTTTPSAAAAKVGGGGMQAPISTGLLGSSGEDWHEQGSKKRDMAWLLSLPKAFFTAQQQQQQQQQPAAEAAPPSRQPSIALLRAAASLGAILTPAQRRRCEEEEDSERHAAQQAYEDTQERDRSRAAAASAAASSAAAAAAAATAAAPQALVAATAAAGGEPSFTLPTGRGRRFGKKARATAAANGMLMGEGGALAWDGSKPFPFARGGTHGPALREGEVVEDGEEEVDKEPSSATPEASAKHYAKKSAARFG